MNYEESKRVLGLRPTPEVDFACRYLESVGFLWHQNFYTTNAIEKASGVMLVKLEDEYEREDWRSVN